MSEAVFYWGGVAFIILMALYPLKSEKKNGRDSVDSFGDQVRLYLPGKRISKEIGFFLHEINGGQPVVFEDSIGRYAMVKIGGNFIAAKKSCAGEVFGIYFSIKTDEAHELYLGKDSDGVLLPSGVLPCRHCS